MEVTEEKGFYKNDNGVLLYAPKTVLHKDFALKIEEKDTYKYPIQGWTYFDTKANAMASFGITEPEEEPIEKTN